MKTTANLSTSRLLAGLSVASILLYVISSPLYLVGSLTIGDIWMLVVVCGLLVLDEARKRVLRLICGSYGVIALSITVALLVAALNADDILGALSFAAQFLYTVWVVIPIIAAGLAEHGDVFRLLRRFAWGYLGFFALGLYLLIGFGSDVILALTGNGRIGQQFTTQVFQYSVMSIGVAGTLFNSCYRYSYAVLLTCSIIPVLLNANRTGLVSYALLAVIALLASIRNFNSFITTVVIGTFLVIVGYLTIDSGLFRDVLEVRVLDSAEFFQDQARLTALNASFEAIQQNSKVVLFGAGWGGSGSEIVVHNLIIQVIHEGGLIVLCTICALLALPLVWAFGGRNNDRATEQFVLMMTGIFVLFWMLNSLSVERPYWLAYAVALGVAYGLRLRRTRSREEASFDLAGTNHFV